MMYTNVKTSNKQAYTWRAMYSDGASLSEFEGDKESSFYAIEKDRLDLFGIIGKGNEYFYDCSNGVFLINGKELHVALDSIPLHGQPGGYTDIIQFKNAESTLDPFRGGFSTKIVRFNYGYKKKFVSDGVEYSVKLMYHVPDTGDTTPYFSLSVVCDRDVSHNIYTNDVLIGHLDLKANIGGEITWQFQQPLGN